MTKRKASGTAAMKWKKAPDQLVAVFAKILEPLPAAQTRQMFGYPAAFVNGHMFAGLFQAEMFVRLSGTDQRDFSKQAGAHPFEPMPGHAMRDYLVVPNALLKEPVQLRTWVQRAFTYTKGLPPKAKKNR